MATPTKPSDILDRTIANIDCINAMKTLQGEPGKTIAPFEVTQLLNSFLLTVLQNWDELEAGWCNLPQGNAPWPEVTTSEGKQHPKDIIGKLRDALAHGLFTIEGENGEIDSIHFWTCTPPEYKDVNWHATLSLSVIRSILDGFVHVTSRQNLRFKTKKQKGDKCQ